MDLAASEDDARGNRRTIVILALVAVLVLGALAYFFVFAGGDGEGRPTTRFPRARSTGAVPTPTKAPAVVKAPKLSKKAVGKDPFKALVVQGLRPRHRPPFRRLGGGTTTTGGTTHRRSAPAVTGGGTTGDRGGSATSTKPLTVKVLSVAADNTSGRVTVGGQDLLGRRRRRLRHLLQDAAAQERQLRQLPYGDERFDLCEGETAQMQ